MRERLWPCGRMTTTPFDRTAHSAICRQPPTPKSPLPELNGTGRFRYVGAPRPVPLHHRAIRAQMKLGFYSSADEAWGSGHGDNIHSPGDLANRCARRKGLRNNRSLLLRAPPPAPLRTRQHLNSSTRLIAPPLLHRCTRQCLHNAKRIRIIPARARRLLTEGYRWTPSLFEDAFAPAT